MNIKKFFSFLKSMRFGLILLGILCLVSIIGSLIPQGQEEGFYFSNFSPLWAQVIISFKLFDIYHSPGFIILSIALATNLFLCSTLRFKKMIHQIKKASLPPTKDQLKNPLAAGKFYDFSNINDLFMSQGFRNIKKIPYESSELYYSTKNKTGYLGSYLIHLGILAIIIFYSYGQYTFIDTQVYGVPGSAQAVEGTDYIMHIDDFNILYREDGSVEQYITEATLTDQEGNELVSGEIYVNHPMRYKGYTFYQHSTGWTSEIHVNKAGENLASEILYEGTAYINNDEFIIVQMHHFYPDFIATEAGFATKSNILNHPKILYSILYGGQRIDMNLVAPDEDIHWQDFTFRFTRPQPYTYLLINKMKGKLGAIFGSIIMVLGLFLAFFMKPKQLILEKKDGKIYIYGDYSPGSEALWEGNGPRRKDLSV